DANGRRDATCDWICEGTIFDWDEKLGLQHEPIGEFEANQSELTWCHVDPRSKTDFDVTIFGG
ncbi:MAG: hypothetical protein ACRC2T_11085, partial [Thermoguttaceae bacterium]